MLYKTLSAAVYGIDAAVIEVEVDVSGIRRNEDHFMTVGLPDAAVRESRERIRAALRNCGYDIPPTDITINLAPADIKKEGSGYDLPMALGILGAYGGIARKQVRITCWSANFPSTAACVAFGVPFPLRLKLGDERFPAWSFPKPTPRKPPWWPGWTSIQFALCLMSSTS